MFLILGYNEDETAELLRRCVSCYICLLCNDASQNLIMQTYAYMSSLRIHLNFPLAM